jgi:hypothetical protein
MVIIAHNYRKLIDATTLTKTFGFYWGQGHLIWPWSLKSIKIHGLSFCWFVYRYDTQDLNIK